MNDVSLAVNDGEFFTLLGPSGCGKTTLLRLVAGFAELENGEIRFGQRRIDNLPPHKRDAGMVFQNYAIFPNLKVADNVAYGLRARRIAPSAIAPRVGNALRLVHLADHARHWPHQLSGGQLQRVAIARALVIAPQVLLLDEPLSNLDARLRIEMRSEIRELQKTLGITAIYVTHDQEEALSISDRIAVMRAGGIEQIGAPREIYLRPATAFVAEFMGTTNLLGGVVADLGRSINAGASSFRVARQTAPDGTRVVFCLRPEALRPLGAGEPVPKGWGHLGARLLRFEFLGPLTRIEARLADGTLLRVASLGEPVEGLEAGGDISLAYDPSRITVLPA